MSAGTPFSSNASLKFSVIVAPFTTALVTVGAVVSAGVLLVTVRLAKPSTSAIPVPAALSLFVPGV